MAGSAERPPTRPARLPLGIDLGTTFSVVAQVDAKGVPRSIPNMDGDLLTPSVVFFEGDRYLVGKEAVKAAASSPEMVARHVKREMGKTAFWKSFNGESYPPEVIQSLVLEHLKRAAQLKVGQIADAVITVPAYFSEPKRRATQDAGRLAGLNVLDIINEPTAAAIAFGVEEGFLNAEGDTPSGETVLVYDLGGGTFDVSVVQIESKRFRVIATDGDFQLGGIDWDQKLSSFIAEAFSQEFSIDPRQNASGEQLLLHEAEEAKRSLSVRSEVTVRFSYAGHTVRVPIRRKAFEEMTAAMVDRTRFTTSQVVKEAGLKWSDISRVLLVGGSTRMPSVVKMLETESGKKVDRTLAADEAVAHGAAIYASLLTKQRGLQTDVEITNVNSHNLGVLGLEKRTGRNRTKVLLPRNTALPAKQGAAFTTAEDDQRTVAVKVVEGGDASGKHSTPIGKCVIRGLPAGLPAGTQVNVIFQYEPNGRLRVRASIPTLGHSAKIDIQRESALSDSKLDDWGQRLRNRFRPFDINIDSSVDEEEEDDGFDINLFLQ